MPKTILCYSGGLDSTVLLYWLRDQGHEVRCLSVHYGQRHNRELDSSVNICMKLGVELKQIELGMSGVFDLLKGSSQTDASINVPEGHYEEDSMRTTVVPNRNMILLSLAGAWAVSTKSDNVGYAAHAGDHCVYMDCRPEFATCMAKALLLCDFHPIELLRPFVSPVGYSKADIVKLGAALGVPFEKTYSCYKGGEKHCGRCGTCTERKESFQLAGVKDPTSYED